MNFNLNSLKNFFFYIVLIFIYIIIFELISRTIIYVNSKNSEIFFYGLNKEITLEIADLSKLNFAVRNEAKKGKIKNLNKKNRENEKDKTVIWIFGASLTYGFSCGKNSSSWPIELSKLSEKFKVVNFAFPAKYSEDSIKILNYNLQLQNNNIPDIIIWAHRDEEKLSYYKGIKRNSNKIQNNFSSKRITSFEYFMLRVNKTLNSNFSFYVLLDHIILKLNLSKKNKPRPNDKDLLITMENFKLNTIDAITSSKNYGVQNFFILSLFSDDEFDQEYSIFLKEYFKIAENLSVEDGVFFINTKKFLTPNQKNTGVNTFYCENKHFNLIGNVTISKVINQFLKSLN